MTGELLAGAGVALERARADRGRGGTRHVHGPARRDRHRARAGAVAVGGAGRASPACRRSRSAQVRRHARARRAGRDRRAPRRGIRRRLSRHRANVAQRAGCPRARLLPRISAALSRRPSERTASRGPGRLRRGPASSGGSPSATGRYAFASISSSPERRFPRIARRCTWWTREAICELGARAPAVGLLRGDRARLPPPAGRGDRSGARRSAGGLRAVTELSAAQPRASHVAARRDSTAGLSPICPR